MASSKKTVCLIQPPPSFSNTDGCLPSEYVGVGLLALSAFLESHGHKTRIFHIPNALKVGYMFRGVLQEIAASNPDIFALSLNWVHFSAGALETAAELKKHFPRHPIVLGGQHATLFASEIVADFSDNIDAVIIGEAELPLLRICESVGPDGKIPGGLRGVCIPGCQPEYFQPDYVQDIDTLPLQSFRRLWPVYSRPLAAVSTMRGACHHNCIYCLEGRSGTFLKRTPRQLHSTDYIVEQIKCFASEGKTIITIQDQFSSRGDIGAIELAERMAAGKSHLKEMNIFAEPGSFGPGGLQALGTIPADTISLDFGVETGAPGVARASGIFFKSSNFLQQLRETTAAGILPFTWWMIGFPGEGREELRQTREFIIETMSLGGIPRWVTPLVLFPQTEMALRADYYRVKQRLTSFLDFARFSLEPRNEMGHYPSIGTHDTDTLTHRQISDEVLALKMEILKNWDLLDSFYKNNPALLGKYRAKTIMLGTEKEKYFSLDGFF